MNPPRTLELVVDLAEALARPRNECLLQAPDQIPLTSPDGEQIGTLGWDMEQSIYRFRDDV